jgi:hypothetical protein
MQSPGSGGPVAGGESVADRLVQPRQVDLLQVLAPVDRPVSKAKRARSPASISAASRRAGVRPARGQDRDGARTEPEQLLAAAALEEGTTARGEAELADPDLAAAATGQWVAAEVVRVWPASSPSVIGLRALLETEMTRVPAAGGWEA